MSEQNKLNRVIDEMTVRAGEAALTAWAKCVADGTVGALPIPENLNLRSFARKYFLIGYSMALVDHTMDATQRMRAAADADQGVREVSLTDKIRGLFK